MGALGPENHDVASFLVTKLSNWRGKYKRIMSIGSHALTTYNPSSLEVTNQWPYTEILAVKPAERLEFILHIQKKKKRDTMRFTSEYRSELLYEFLQAKILSEAQKKDVWRFDACKHHWSGTKLPVTLEVTHFGIRQLDPTSKQHLTCYPFYAIEGISLADDSPQALVITIVGFGRLHIFDVIDRADFIHKVQENALAYSAIHIKNLKSFPSVNKAMFEKFGSFNSDENLASLIEFPVHKIQLQRHSDAVRRLLCMTETCLLERDPDSYSICTLKPLEDVFALVRNPDDEQSFTIEFVHSGVRHYRATERDALLATLLDGVRSSGNRDIHVRSNQTNRGWRFTPLWQAPDEEVETMHLRWLIQPPPPMTLSVAVLRFNTSVNYSGLLFASTQEGIFFTENKDKSIHAALLALVDDDLANNQDKANAEQEFLALRRLVASKAGFAAFTNLPGLREKLGLKVVRALQWDRDNVSQAAIDVLCALMEPMYDESDLRQEQLNKSSLLSSPKFIEGILERWTQHILRGTGALVVISVLDFLTFALCAPYSETTDGGHFDALLALIAKRGRELFRLLQHPSLSIIKGAGLLMRAVVEEGDESLAARMQQLALSEAALPRHLLTAFYTRKTAGSVDGRLLMNRQLSRKLVALWTSSHPEALSLLQRVLPAGLLGFLDSSETVPANADDELGEGVPNRDNLKIATDQFGYKSNPQWQIAVERQLKAAHKMVAKHVEGALQHWRSKNHASRRQDKPKERPVVLRRRRQRVKAEGNWDMLFYQFWKEHALPNLIWNAKTREELREALESELRTCAQDRELSGSETIAWNHTEFEVHYPSLTDEVRVGDYYLRILLQHNQQTGSLGIDIKDPVGFFDELYRRFLTAPKSSLRLPCLQAMALVYGRHKDVIGAFPDTGYLVSLLDRTFDYEERDRLVCVLAQLVNEPKNIKAILDTDGLRSLIDLLPLAHLHTRRAVLATQSNVIEAGQDMQRPADKEKEWYYANAAGERMGPFSLNEMKEMFQKATLTAKSRCWAQGFDGWKAMQNVTIFKWTVMASGSPLLNESDLAATILNILIKICEHFPSRDAEGAVIRPLPRVKKYLSDSVALSHVVQLLLTFDPILVEKVATLLALFVMDNPLLPRLFTTGVFFFVLMYTGSNVLPIARFLQLTHANQALGLDDNSSDQILPSVLSPLLPEAMIRYLNTYGPEEFSKVFLGEFDTPEVIWGSEMRRMLIEKIAAHLADFSPRLQSNPRALYQFCPIPAVAYPQLEKELFCHAYYLRHLCDTVRFPDWPIREPVLLLRQLLDSWKREVEKKPSGMTEDDALATLGIPKETAVTDAVIRKAYFRLAQQYHPDKNPEGRVMFEKVAVAYQWLCNRGLRITDGPDPNNILLLLQAQTIVFDRYGTELEPFKYPGYPQLLRTIRFETEDSQLFSKTTSLLGAGAALAYQTVRCSALNAEELRREGGLEALLEAMTRCIPMIGLSSKADDVPVEVCTFASKCMAVAARFPACRDRLAEQKILSSEISRLLSLRHLPKLCQAACECVAALAQDSVLQLQLLQAGALWHLLILLFDYDFTLDEGGVQRSESSNKQEVANSLAKGALFACARMGGYLKNEYASPPNNAVQEALNAMLTPYLVRQLGVWTAEEFLKVLTNNTESPVLIWDNSTRSQLLEFLLSQQREHIRSGESDLTYGATYVHQTHASELIVGGIFVRIYNRQPDFPLENPARFAVDLLDFLQNLSGNNEGDQTVIEPGLQSLFYVLKAVPAIALQCLGRFRLLFQLLKSQQPTTAHLSLQVIHLACQQTECVVDIGVAQVLGYLFYIMRFLRSSVALSLETLYSLLSNTPIVKEALAKGGVIFILDIFCNETDADLRVRAAELLARMSADRLVGGKVRIQMSKFLPPLFADAMRDAPSTSVQLFESSSENPELIWTDDMRSRLCRVLRRMTKRHLLVLNQDPSVEWAGMEAEDESELPNLETEPNVGGIYLRLLAANPGWILRKPKEILGDLIEAGLQGAQKEPESEKTSLIVSSLCGLLQTQPVLLEHIPALGPLPRLLRALSSATDPSVNRPSTVAAGLLLRLLNPMCGSMTCVDALSKLECISPIAAAMRTHAELTMIGLEALEKLIRHSSSNSLSSGSGSMEELTQQCVSADLVTQLLKLLEESSMNPHLTPAGRALVVSILKNLVNSRLHGLRIATLLDQSPAWSAYKDQRHDLFLQASGTTAGALPPAPGGGGVAGYLTQHSHHQRVGPAPARQLPPPTDPLQSRD